MSITATELQYIIFSGLYAVVASVILTGAVRHLAVKSGFADMPGHRKVHTKPIALGGGIAIFLSVIVPLAILAIAVLLVSPELVSKYFGDTVSGHLPGLKKRAPQLLVFVLGAAVLHITGLIDDRKAMGPRIKLFIQLAVALLLATLGEIRFDFFIDSYVIRVLLSVLWITVIINAFNFLDNMDGLSAGIAAICSLIILFAAVNSGQVFISCFLALIVGALIGFLFYNFNPASIFMGDAGSLLVGLFMAVASIKTTYYHAEGASPRYSALMPLIILAVPLYDFGSVVIIRILQGKSPFVGDKQHFSHRLTNHGMSQRTAVLTIYLATAVTGLGAAILHQVKTSGMILIFAQAILILTLIGILEYTGKTLETRKDKK